LPFLDCVARCHNTLVNDSERLSALSLVNLGEEGFELVPVAV
jgi:hypothetical protein